LEFSYPVNRTRTLKFYNPDYMQMRRMSIVNAVDQGYYLNYITKTQKV
jgi:hypothetical protein